MGNLNGRQSASTPPLHDEQVIGNACPHGTIGNFQCSCSSSAKAFGSSPPEQPRRLQTLCPLARRRSASAQRLGWLKPCETSFVHSVQCMVPSFTMIRQCNKVGRYRMDHSRLQVWFSTLALYCTKSYAPARVPSGHPSYTRIAEVADPYI